jgi:hypothetical protein
MKAPAPLDREQLLAVSAIVQCEWIERLWVRQEVGLGGSNSCLQYGDTLVAWDKFCQAIYIIHEKPLHPCQFLSDAAETRVFRDRVALADTVALYSKGSFRFINLRRRVGTSKCSDSRDRIYGVLGQLRDGDRLLTWCPTTPSR